MPNCITKARFAPPRPSFTERALSLLALFPLSLVFLLQSYALPAHAVMATDGGPIAVRLTSTGLLDADELNALDLQGRFGSFLGTPVDETHFLTAQHIGISPSDTISFASGPNLGTYSIVQWHDDPESDLRIVEINGTFNEWALLFGSTDETGRSTTIFGRGGAPIQQVTVGSELKGWTAASPDGAISWGRNIVTGTLGGDLLYARFDINGLDEEAGLTSGDSGGAWFVKDAVGLSRLAGISFSTTGPYQLDQNGSPDGSVFQAGIFDIGGLWVGSPGNEVFIQENPVNVPGVGIATRVSDRIEWMTTIIDLAPEDTDDDGILNAFDNCPFVANANQLDNGGLGFGTVGDGIGNVCQCGDVTGEGQVNDTDAAFIKRHALGLAAPLFLVPDHCDVTGDGICNGTDASYIRQAAAGLSNPNFGQNCPNALP
ncbi:MAG: dockerin type I domain-containing protein [Myxococcota bacterium]